MCWVHVVLLWKFLRLLFVFLIFTLCFVLTGTTFQLSGEGVWFFMKNIFWSPFCFKQSTKKVYTECIFPPYLYSVKFDWAFRKKKKSFFRALLKKTILIKNKNIPLAPLPSRCYVLFQVFSLLYWTETEKYSNLRIGQ